MYLIAKLHIPLYSAFSSKDDITNTMCILLWYYFFFIEYMIPVYAAMSNCSVKIES